MRVRLFASLPPPYGGVNSWTRNYLDAAAAHRLEVTLSRTGTAADRSHFGPLAPLRRLGRGTLRPLWALGGRLGDDAVGHVCVSGGASFWRGLALAAVAAARRTPLVVHLHSRLRTCDPAARRAAARLACVPWLRFVTPHAADAAAGRGWVGLPHLVPSAAAPPRRPLDAAATAPLRLLFVGWMVRAKGIFDLLDAVAQLPDAELDAYGPAVRPAELRRWQRQVRRRRLGERVRYRGVVAAPAVTALMARHDALVFPSHDESFGMVPAEAMATAMPVVGTRVGLLAGAPAGSFVEVPARAPAALAAALRPAARAALSRCGPQGRAYVRAAFCEGPVMGRWQALYAQLAAAAARPPEAR